MAFDISDQLSRKRLNPPMKSFLWRVILPDLNMMTNARTSSIPTFGDGIFEALSLDLYSNHEVSSRIANISIPFVTIDTEKASQQNSFWYYGKHNDIGTITLEVYEYEDGLTLDYFRAWEHLMINKSGEFAGTYNPPAMYKQDIIFYRLSSMHTELVKHTYKGYFISGINDLQNDYDGNEVVRYSITLTGDSIEHETFSLATLADKPEEAELLAKSLKHNKQLPEIDEIIQNALFS
jgi:hypothetical protein